MEEKLEFLFNQNVLQFSFEAPFIDIEMIAPYERIDFALTPHEAKELAEWLMARVREYEASANANIGETTSER